MSAPLNVIVYKWNVQPGDSLETYKADHVNWLQEKLDAHLTIPWKMVCYTDDPAGVECETRPLITGSRKMVRCTYKLATFSLTGGYRIAQIDLDMEPVGNLDELFSYDGEFGILRNCVRHQRARGGPYNDFEMGGALVMWEAGKHRHVWDDFEAGDWRSIYKEKRVSDQQWYWLSMGTRYGHMSRASDFRAPYDFLQERYPGQLVDVKVEAPGPNARLLIYRGKRKPWTKVR